MRSLLSETHPLRDVFNAIPENILSEQETCAAESAYITTENI